MKRKIFSTMLLVTCFLLINTVTFALFSSSEKKQNAILTGEKIDNVNEAYQEIEYEKLSKSNVLSNKTTIDDANLMLANINVSEENKIKEDVNIKYYNNLMENRIEKVMSDSNTILKMDAQTGEFISYINNKTEFETCFDDEKVVKEKAINIFNKLNIDSKDSYELNYVEQFDDEIWRASFVKSYGEYINKGESVNFSFSPQNNEIVTLAINKIIYENNEIVINREDAIKIAEKYLEKSVATEMEIYMDIVHPNYFLQNLKGDASLYKNIPIERLAYVAKFNNEASSEIYIDATTGEVIGGNMRLGGKF